MTPEEIRAHKCNQFATMDSPEHVIGFYNVQGLDAATIWVAVNSALEVLAKEAEEQCPST